MRETAGTTEKWVGGLVLLILSGVLVAFVVQSTSNKKHLFQLDEAALKQQQEAREIGVARQMLPSLEGLGWRAVAQVEVIAAGELLAALGQDAADLASFDVEWVYRQQYETNTEPRRKLIVMVCDAATAAQAFGLCGARRAAEAEPLNVGRGGWRVSSDGGGARAGFWNGRYYTELSSPEPAGATMTLAAAADVIASVQLGYGGPFEAEKLLPTTGRVPGTFRYVHRRALGHDLLNEVFLVDLAGGATAWLMDAKSPAAGRTFVERLKATAPQADDEGDGNGFRTSAGGPAGEAQQGKAVAVAGFDGRQMAFFAAGKYVYGVCGDDSASVLAAAERVYARAARGGIGSQEAVAAQVGETAAEGPFPDPGLAGWQPPQEVSRYTPEDLYVKIDGRAGLYIQFSVVGLTFGTYSHERDSGRTIDVYWYDMGEPVNAFGIYRAEAAQGAEPVAIGRQGYQTGGAVFFWKGGSYVQVLPSASDADEARAALEIARRIGGVIEDDGEPLWAASVLPESGRVADSLDYLAANAFSLEFLNKVFTADYDVEDGRLKLFIHRAADEASAAALLEEYAAFFEQYGEVIWRDPDGSRRMIAGASGGLIDVVFAKGRYLGGVAGAEQAEAARKAAVAFYDELSVP